MTRSTDLVALGPSQDGRMSLPPIDNSHPLEGKPGSPGEMPLVEPEFKAMILLFMHYVDLARSSNTNEEEEWALHSLTPFLASTIFKKVYKVDIHPDSIWKYYRQAIANVRTANIQWKQDIEARIQAKIGATIERKQDTVTKVMWGEIVLAEIKWNEYGVAEVKRSEVAVAEIKWDQDAVAEIISSQVRDIETFVEVTSLQKILRIEGHGFTRMELWFMSKAIEAGGDWSSKSWASKRLRETFFAIIYFKKRPGSRIEDPVLVQSPSVDPSTSHKYQELCDFQEYFDKQYPHREDVSPYEKKRYGGRDWSSNEQKRSDHADSSSNGRYHLLDD